MFSSRNLFNLPLKLCKFLTPATSFPKRYMCLYMCVCVCVLWSLFSLGLSIVNFIALWVVADKLWWRCCARSRCAPFSVPLWGLTVPLTDGSTITPYHLTLNHQGSKSWAELYFEFCTGEAEEWYMLLCCQVCCKHALASTLVVSRVLNSNSCMLSKQEWDCC